MGVDKVILRAFLSTLAAIVILLLFMFTALTAIYPQTMMEITYDLGMESSSIRFAEESYKRNKEVEFIAYAMEVAIGEGKTDKIISCGEKLIIDKDFAEYCNKRDAQTNVETEYKQYVYGQICVAMYEKGNKQEAVARAFELIGNTFSRNNAAVALAFTAKNVADMETVTTIREKMNALKTEGQFDEDTAAYLDGVLARLDG